MRRLLVLLVLGAVVLSTATPAMAHGEDGTLEVVDAVPTVAGDEVTYTVELTYANDGDTVDGAIVSATVRGPGGPQEPLAAASIGEGWYAVPIRFPGPGRWTVTFSSAEPVATVEVSYEVPATPPSTTTAPPATTTTTPPESDPTIVDDDTDLDDGPPAGLIVGAVLAGAALVAVVVVLVLRRRSLD